MRRLAQRIRSRLRERGHVRVHIGASSPSPAPRGLAHALREALLALEWALHKNQELVSYADQQERCHSARRAFVRFRTSRARFTMEPPRNKDCARGGG